MMKTILIIKLLVLVMSSIYCQSLQMIEDILIKDYYQYNVEVLKGESLKYATWQTFEMSETSFSHENLTGNGYFMYIEREVNGTSVMTTYINCDKKILITKTKYKNRRQSDMKGLHDPTNKSLMYYGCMAEKQ